MKIFLLHLLGDACSLQQSVVWKDLFRDWHIQIHQPNTVGSCRVLARLQKAVGLHYCSAVSTVISCRVLLVLQSSSRCFGVLRLLYVGSALLLCWQHPHCSPLPKRNLSVTKVKGESCSGIWLLVLPHDKMLCGGSGICPDTPQLWFAGTFSSGSQLQYSALKSGEIQEWVIPGISLLIQWFQLQLSK